MIAKRDKPTMPSQTELRSIFSANLRVLVRDVRSVSSLCRELSIHRSLFNRFLDGASFPRPEVLYKICQYFDVDARILLEPIETLRKAKDVSERTRLMTLHPEVAKHFIIGDTPLDTHIMPAGVYRFTRGSFFTPNRFQTGLIQIYEKDGCKFSRGYMARDVAKHLGVDVNSARERKYRGVVYGTGRGVVSQAAHYNSKSCSFTYLEVANFVERTCLVGFCARSMAGTSEMGPVTPAVYERLKGDLATIQQAARVVGIHREEELPKFIQSRLKDVQNSINRN